MSQGYEQYFKKVKSGAKKPKVRAPSLPVMPLFFMVVSLGTALYGYKNIDKIESFIDRIEFEILGGAEAASDSSQEKSAQTNTDKEANSTGPVSANKKPECTEMKGFTEEELSHFNKLNDRKNELDLRDRELTALEEELHKQRVEVEERIRRLDRVREEVAGVLKDRVEVDQQKVSTLVDFYMNMKPKQAADIFTNLNEDLAVEVLSKMKKKSAAEILNLIEPAKARALSEKFTGYKRR